jgi:hypothetical protein
VGLVAAESVGESGDGVAGAGGHGRGF